MMESNSIMNSADVEMQKVVVADLIRLSPDEWDVLNQFDLATCDERIQELTDHQMTLQRENAAKLELSKAEERAERAEAKLVDLKSDELKKASSQKGVQTPTSQTLTKVLEVKWSPVVSCQIPLP
ncbi:hypothetical protein ILYODFUR_036359 [Ilyodon furcidens]|uniref:Uncharacterized protein n=1 Tax=Ilyodon furcidens TaxID=33524 RepID=A0ABV0U0N2_9TELE